MSTLGGRDSETRVTGSEESSTTIAIHICRSLYMCVCFGLEVNGTVRLWRQVTDVDPLLL